MWRDGPCGTEYAPLPLQTSPKEVESFDRMNRESEEGDGMRIAVSTQGKDLDARVNSRFGRAPHFIVVDTDAISDYRSGR